VVSEWGVVRPECEQNREGRRPVAYCKFAYSLSAEGAPVGGTLQDCGYESDVDRALAAGRRPVAARLAQTADLGIDGRARGAAPSGWVRAAGVSVVTADQTVRSHYFAPVHRPAHAGGQVRSLSAFQDRALVPGQLHSLLLSSLPEPRWCGRGGRAAGLSACTGHPHQAHPRPARDRKPRTFARAGSGAAGWNRMMTRLC
jgi:hypothetical protein